MSTTISTQNALQIRERPMDVFVTLQTGGSARISSYAPQGSYKSYDSTLGNTAYSMRNVADLAGEGFPLDGSYELYDPSETPSTSDGKLGLRGNAGANLVVKITASATLAAITIATRGVGTISVGGTSYPSTGLNVIPIGSASATLTLTPAEVNGRAEVDYIVPGVTLTATSETLTRCTLALRGNLDVIDHTWEESEIEIEMYYPYDISSAFAYVQNNWPITYQAGYDNDMSEVRRFYLSEPVMQQDNIITIKGVDASYLLDQKSLQEQWFTVNNNYSIKALYDKFVSAVQGAGIKLVKKQSISGTNSGAKQYAILPEMTARDFVSSVMNLTLSHRTSGVSKAVQFVDAGIPAIEYGDGTNFGSIWTLNKSDLGDWQEVRERNISEIRTSSDDHNFAEGIALAPIISPGGRLESKKSLFGTPNGKFYTTESGQPQGYQAVKKDQWIETSYDGYYYGVAFEELNVVINTPSGFKGRAKSDSSIKNISPQHWEVKGEPHAYGTRIALGKGTKAFSNPNGLPGHSIEMEPFVYGYITDMDGESLFNYASLFNRSTHTVSFTWKGDPRMQPLDYLRIIDDTKAGNPVTWYRVAGIELSHEGGGTTANFTAREWTAPAGA